MKSLRKNSSYKFPDGITRKIINVERLPGNKMFSTSDYACYTVEPPFYDDDNYFEKYSSLYDEVIKINYQND